MPGDQPVRTRRLVEQRGAERHRSLAKELRGELLQPRVFRDGANRWNIEQMSRSRPGTRGAGAADCLEQLRGLAALDHRVANRIAALITHRPLRTRTSPPRLARPLVARPSA